jgi:hypothetical protein
MTIEFQTPSEKVPEKLINDIIPGLSHIYRNISRAEVVMKEDRSII